MCKFNKLGYNLFGSWGNIIKNVLKITGGWGKRAWYSFRVKGVWWYEPSFFPELVYEFPENFIPYTLYIEGNILKKDFYYLGMLCPCGCNEKLVLNLINDVRPVWRISYDNLNKISVYPSINRQVNCKSHFWIRSGRLRWSKDYA
ncbi:DUF6527 family protein [Leeuwenhoekiella sp. LLG6367-2.1]|uniref:DUF6527 family protein n=1 Tax=Leeuwenhoekiella sp. LLG6367-2.1 TaxID=3160833 RepID=UPI00386E3F73